MINANELRIGNIVGIPIAEAVLHGINLPDGEALVYTDDFSQIPINALDGIKLTEEWLVKFGFEVSIENTGAPIHEDLKSFKLDGYEFSEDCNGEWFLCGYNWNTKHFKYVHQLQNIYFALTQHELTISENVPA